MSGTFRGLGFAEPLAAKKAKKAKPEKPVVFPEEKRDQYWDGPDWDEDTPRNEIIKRIVGEFHRLPPPTDDKDKSPDWDKSQDATNKVVERWSARLRKQGYSEDDIRQIISDAVTRY